MRSSDPTDLSNERVSFLNCPVFTQEASPRPVHTIPPPKPELIGVHSLFPEQKYPHSITASLSMLPLIYKIFAGARTAVSYPPPPQVPGPLSLTAAQSLPALGPRGTGSGAPARLCKLCSTGVSKGPAGQAGVSGAPM